MHWIIVKNELPDSILQAVLKVGVEADNSDQWQLLRWGNTRKIYRYQPDGNQPACLVKWGCRHNFGQWRRALLGRNEAIMEQRATQLAIDSGLPAVACRLLAVTNRWRWPKRTLLVFEYLANANTLHAALDEALNLNRAVKPVLQKTAELTAEIHRAEILHGDLSSTNILVDEKDCFHIVDCKGLRRLDNAEPAAFRADLARLLEDFIRVGLRPLELEFFLHAYLNSMGVQPEKRKPWIEDLPAKARRRRIEISRRAFRNCTRRSRPLLRFSYRGFIVFMFKNQNRRLIEETLSFLIKTDSSVTEKLDTIVFKGQIAAGPDSEILHFWRMANAVDRSGLYGHIALAYAHRGRPSNTEFLLCKMPPGCRPVFDFLNPPSTRKNTLKAAGDFFRRLHEVKINMVRFHAKDWFVKRPENGALQFYCGDLRAYEFFEEESLEKRFQWLVDWLKTNPESDLGAKDLVEFLTAYGAGRVDRFLWRHIISAAGQQFGRAHPG